MDKLLTSFTKKYINKLNENDLILLSNLLDNDDEDLYKLNHNIQTDNFFKNNKVIELFKNYEYRSD
jgi:succinate dehydrogenase flavin-adding protein (antitoxin of CptAB toxin-antitoxin module)